MQVHLVKKIGLKGQAMTNQWVAAIREDNGNVLFQKTGITAKSALRDLQDQVSEVQAAIDEFRRAQED